MINNQDGLDPVAVIAAVLSYRKFPDGIVTGSWVQPRRSQWPSMPNDLIAYFVGQYDEELVQAAIDDVRANEVLFRYGRSGAVLKHFRQSFGHADSPKRTALMRLQQYSMLRSAA